MQRILVLNSKGGCGKTTIATNLASLYAGYGFATALMDYDPQGSSTRWHSLRPQDKPAIHGVSAWQRAGGGQTSAWQFRLPPQTERVILDAPAAVSGQQLVNYVQRVDTILVPVLPSPIDIHAATHFIKDLLLIGKVRSAGVRVGVIANRAKKNTLVYQSLERFLKTLHLPLLATLRDTQHYVHAVERGIGVHEMWDKRAEEDRLQWINVFEWLEDRRAAVTVQQRHAP
ncbi:AAA family ATPase [Thiohalophilus sp.]|uniref:nucleotide-binding protein n=1 Tax=Thiohalophilus sp. TaxID=3028392 RepID=UPI002ACE643F|nr:AAA family ATPase [Thiohalophilus sp.]MDZ7803017.1 AAA family ATPase [Thiohalophilus sp.]